MRRASLRRYLFWIVVQAILIGELLSSTVYVEKFVSARDSQRSWVLDSELGTFLEPTETWYQDDLKTSTQSDWYEIRLRAKLKIPRTGIYKFAIKADDQGALYLSKSSVSGDRELIAFTNLHSGGSWSRYESQISDDISLIKGDELILEARMREFTGNDYLSVGWNYNDLRLVSLFWHN